MSFTQLLAILLALQVAGPSFFYRFMTEVPPVSIFLKWTLMHGLTIGLYFVIGGWSLVVPGLMLTLGIGLHVYVCRRYRIHPLRATPRRAYYKLRGWAWPPE